MNALPPNDHNFPPPYDPDKLEAARVAVTDFNGAAKEWLDLKSLETAGQSQRLTDFVAGARKLAKKIDATRDDQKRPHDERAKAVQSAFKPLLDAVSAMIDRVKPLQEDWLKRVRDEEEKRRAEERQRAEAERLAAEEARKAAAATNDVAGQVEAERWAKEAAAVEAVASKEVRVSAGSATGSGRTMALRKTYEVEITNPLSVFMRYRSHPDVIETLRRLVSADVRSAGYDGSPIDGAKITVRETVA